MAGINWGKKMPTDQGNNVMTNWPANVKAINRTYNDNVVASSIFTLNDNTCQIEVAAGRSDAFLRWVPSTETAGVAPFGSVLANNFDHVIPAGTYRQFVVPKESQGLGQGVQSFSSVNGLYQRVAINKVNAATGTGSVMVTEY